MTMLKRFTQLFKADVHALLDQLEEPEALLKQALREMEEEHRKTLIQVRMLEQENARNSKRRDELKDIVSGIAGQLDLCFEADNIDLARNLIRRKLENQRLIELLQIQSSKQTDELQHLNGLITEQQQKLQAIRQKAEVYVSYKDERSSAGHASVLASDDCIAGFSAGQRVSEQDIEVALLEEKKRRSR